MAYTFTPDDVAFLCSRHGEKALDTVSGLDLTAGSMLADVAEARSRYAPHDAALIETVALRRRAVTKFREVDDLLLTDDALQQATTSAVAANRAAEIAGVHPGAIVHDVTCSIGAELLELSAQQGIRGVVGSDLDRVRLAMAQHNMRTSARPATLLVADALAPATTADVVIADPARRTGSGRVYRLDALAPPLLDLMMTYAGRLLVVKCAPGLDYQLLRDRYGFSGEVQVTSLDGGVREACLWTGPGIRDGRRATILRTAGDGTITRTEITDGEPDDVASHGDPGTWIIDPDGAVVRAGLVRQFAHRHGLWQLDPRIAYLTGDAVPTGARGFRILERTTTGDKALRKALSAYDCGTLEILVRGLDVDPDRLRKRLRLRGSRSLSLVLTRIGRHGVAFIGEAGIRGGPIS
ncbi:hypothetical protein GCM10009624_13780 [Gordonia sinesedis]